MAGEGSDEEGYECAPGGSRPASLPPSRCRSTPECGVKRRRTRLLVAGRLTRSSVLRSVKLGSIKRCKARISLMMPPRFCGRFRWLA